MPRLRNSRTGVVVNVSDAKVAQLGSEWGPVDEKPAKKPTPRKPKK